MNTCDGATNKVSVRRKWSEDLRRQRKLSDSATTRMTVKMERSMFDEGEVCA